jgi:hypothetical protein
LIFDRHLIQFNILTVVLASFSYDTLSINVLDVGGYILKDLIALREDYV